LAVFSIFSFHARPGFHAHVPILDKRTSAHNASSRQGKGTDDAKQRQDAHKA
jgi:hypothetical protein